MKALARWTANTLFNYVHGNYLVYNTCWEDPRLDREVMAITGDDEIVLVTSAGCNALDYALDRPRRIHAVDMNFRQNALLELKIAAIRRLDFEQFFAVFGDGGDPGFQSWYHQSIRGDLTARARAYWDRRTHYFARPTPDASFYHRGTTGALGRLFVHYLRAARVHLDALRLFSAGSLAEQQEIYHGCVRDKLWRPAIKRALRTDLALSLMGVPQAQREHLERTCGTCVADFIENCVEAVCTRIPAWENYFWRVYLFGRYTRECCPEYLRQENFERLKGGLVDRIEIHTSDLTGFLRRHPGKLSRFVLLDHMDWLSHERPELLVEEWQAIFDRAHPGARVIWRSGGHFVDYVDPLQVHRQGRTRRVGEYLQYHSELARECHERDRVHTYGSFYVADIAA
jgi:S-adenosylmethionine-diacylglycerol 3-amino-3-carboxypropyl transferase